MNNEDRLQSKSGLTDENDQEIVALCIGLEDVDKRLIKDSFIVIVDEELLEEISVTYSSMWSNLRGDKN